MRMDPAIRTSDDPLAKVKGLIQDMTEMLEAQAYCDKELTETHVNKDEKTNEIIKVVHQDGFHDVSSSPTPNRSSGT